LPERRTRLKSVDRVRRKRRFTCTSLCPARMMSSRAVKLLPAHVLDVIIAANSQPDASFQTPALEHLAAICAGHALAKAVHTHAPPDPGLIWTFCCHSLTSKIIIKTPDSGFTAGVFKSVPVRAWDGDGRQL
jgi:hypothetical protein